MRSLREGVYPIIGMTGKTAWLVDAGAGAVTTSATVEGTLMVWCGLAGRCGGGGGVVVMACGSRGFVRVVQGRRARYLERLLLT